MIIKANIKKIEEVSRIQSLYFIDQDLSINSHSYQKIINDIKLLHQSIQKCL